MNKWKQNLGLETIISPLCVSNHLSPKAVRMNHWQSIGLKEWVNLASQKRYEWNSSFCNICNGKSMITYIAFMKNFESKGG